ncbi:hypothetical protein KFZ76_16130 [Methylovulum psychrotolerans]|uniref:hypothetical protein n=1 Tax=Methylovulum psychrotolerans TaxID=1704499 RepID=UPI001BFF9762|nr:hypothetical protein [Methylovulum psychrotolerans]MBT9099223.1 hypothetical protein [Methylovulum psychrotolerans]
MTRLHNAFLSLLHIWQGLKDENLHWQSNRHEQQARLRHAQALADQALTAELAQKTAQLAHDLTLLKTQHDTELELLKTRCQQDIKDYRHYLKSLDQLKQSIAASYRHLPEAVVFTIHHHAKQLLNQMWECDDFQQKMHYEMQLLHFMTTVHDEARLHKEGQGQSRLPEKTLSLLQQD